MQIRSPRRGLLAGLLALVVFASSAVTMTIRSSSSATGNLAQAVPAQTVVNGDDPQIASARVDHHDGNGRGGHRR